MHQSRKRPPPHVRKPGRRASRQPFLTLTGPAQVGCWICSTISRITENALCSLARRPAGGREFASKLRFHGIVRCHRRAGERDMAIYLHLQTHGMALKEIACIATIHSRKWWRRQSSRSPKPGSKTLPRFQRGRSVNSKCARRSRPKTAWN